MGHIWRTIRGYILWTYDRGSVQYDVMVTLILAFIFLAPLWMNFKDKPVERTPHQTGVVVYQVSDRTFTYQVDAAAVSARDDDGVRRDLLGVIEPIAGEVEITGYEPIRDNKGHVTGYKVQVTK
jgi:hypothetical protein